MHIKRTIAGIVLALSSLSVNAIDPIRLGIADYEKNSCFPTKVTLNTDFDCVECLYVIDYGDKKIDTLETTVKPKHLYSDDGSYTVTIKTLKKSDSSEIASKTFNNAVNIYNPTGATIKSDTAMGGHSYIINYSVANFKPTDTTVWRYIWTMHDMETTQYDSLHHVKTKEYFEENIDPGYLVKLRIEMKSESAPARFNWESCFDTISEYIKVEDCFFKDPLEELDNRHAQIFNVITADGDPNDENDDNNVNDVFKVFTNGHDVFTLTIFNNYGNVVYTQTGKEIFWTGVTNSGRRVKSGTYYYAIESNAGKDKHRNTGFIFVFNEDL